MQVCLLSQIITSRLLYTEYSGFHLSQKVENWCWIFDIPGKIINQDELWDKISLRPDKKSDWCFEKSFNPTKSELNAMESFSMLSAIVTFRFLPWPALCTLHNGWKSGWDLAGQGLGDVITKCWSIFGTESHDQIFSDVIIFHKYVSPAARSPLHLNCIFSDLAHASLRSQKWDHMKSKTSHPAWGVCQSPRINGDSSQSYSVSTVPTKRPGQVW